MSDVLEQALERLGASDIRQTPEGYECRCPMCKSSRRSFRVAHVGRDGRLGAFMCHKCPARGGLTELLIRGGMQRDKAEEIAGRAAPSLRRLRYRRVEREELGIEMIAPYRCVLSEWLLQRGYDEEWIWHYRVGMDTVTNEVVYPTYSADGKLVGITRRKAEDGQPSFHLGDFEKSRHLWGIDLAIASGEDCVYLVEGQTGALGLAPVVAPHPVVASFGSNLSKHQAEVLAHHFTTVVLVYDDDPAGRKGAVWAKEALTRKGLDVLFGMIPDDVEDTGELPHAEYPEVEHLTFREWKKKTGWRNYAKRSKSSTKSPGTIKVSPRIGRNVYHQKILPPRR